MKQVNRREGRDRPEPNVAMACVLVDMSSVSSPVSLTSDGSTLRVRAGEETPNTPHLYRCITLYRGDRAWS